MGAYIPLTWEGWGCRLVVKHLLSMYKVPSLGLRKEKIRDPNISKKPPPSAFFFCSDSNSEIKEHPSPSIGDAVAKRWGMWKNSASNGK